MILQFSVAVNLLSELFKSPSTISVPADNGEEFELLPVILQLPFTVTLSLSEDILILLKDRSSETTNSP